MPGPGPQRRAPPEKRTAAPAGLRCCGDLDVEPVGRIRRAAAAIADGLVCGVDFEDLADVLRHRLELPERACVAAASLASLPLGARRSIAAGALRVAADDDPIAREGARMSAMWQRHCAKTWPEAKRRARR